MLGSWKVCHSAMTSSGFPYVEAKDFDKALGKTWEFSLRGNEVEAKILDPNDDSTEEEATLLQSRDHENGIMTTRVSKRNVLVLELKNGEKKNEFSSDRNAKVVATIEGSLVKNEWKDQFPRPVGALAGEYDEKAKTFFKEIEEMNDIRIVIVHWTGIDLSGGCWGTKEFHCLCRPNRYDHMRSLFGKYGVGSKDAETIWIL